jgi:diguanylate cyclase (GGDEF)-like protein
MFPSSSGLVLLHLTPERAHLPEYLAELGFDVAQSQWGVSGRKPRILVTDRPEQLAGNPQLVGILRDGAAGLIVVGGEVEGQAAAHLRVDVTLPKDTTGRELATAIELVGELVEQRERLAHEREECQRWIDLAMHDPLTGLPNRRAWDKRLAESLATKKALCVALIDVDFFKQVNDHRGHTVGDSVLREAARVMRAQLRGEDFVARLGGDEFGVIAWISDAGCAQTVLDRIRRAVSAELAERHLPAPTLSAGFVLIHAGETRDAGRAFSAASTSLQAAKHQSRNRTVAYQQALVGTHHGVTEGTEGSPRR